MTSLNNEKIIKNGLKPRLNSLPNSLGNRLNRLPALRHCPGSLDQMFHSLSKSSGTKKGTLRRSFKFSQESIRMRHLRSISLVVCCSLQVTGQKFGPTTVSVQCIHCTHGEGEKEEEATCNRLTTPLLCTTCTSTQQCSLSLSNFVCMTNCFSPCLLRRRTENYASNEKVGDEKEAS